MTILSTSSQDNRCFNAEIAAKLEDINAAVIVQQLHYWLQKDVGVVIDGVRWVYNSFESWVRTQFKWLSVWQFRKSMSLLRNLGIVNVIRYKAKQWNQTNYYSLDYDRLQEILGTKSSSTKEEKKPESTEIIDLCVTADQSAEYLTLEVRESSKSFIRTENTSEDQTTKQSVAASTEIEEIKTVDVLDAEIGQPEVNCLKQENKVDSGVGNAFNGVEANSSECNIKVINKEWKAQVDELDQLGVRINSTVVKVVKANQKEDVERAIALLRSRKRDGQIENPAGFFVQALKEDWASQISSSQDKGTTFRYWYEIARELGYCQGQEVRDNEQWVLLSGNWEKWQSAVDRGYSVEYLRKVLGRNKNR